jgi:DNA-binding LacI/PurR family transcriptional regulator
MNEQIADSAGVSRSTISRVVNHPDLVSPETLKAVHLAAKNLKVDLSKRSRRGRPRKLNSLNGAQQIGIWFMGTSEDEAPRFLSQQISPLQAACRKNALGVRILFPTADEQIPSAILRREVCGVILEGVHPASEILDAMAGIPTVWVMTRKAEDYSGDFVEPDNTANGHLAADYLLGKGHRRFAYVATEPDYPAFLAREATFKSRISQSGGSLTRITALSHLSNTHMLPEPTVELATEIAGRLLSELGDKGGIYMPGNLALGPLHRGLRRHGVDPARFDWVVGHHDPSLHAQFDPEPAAIDIHVGTIIEAAVQTLMWRISSPKLSGRVGIQVAPSLRLPSGIATTTPWQRAPSSL